MTKFSIQLLYAFLGGLIPALVWLWFWLREDLHPEPKRLLLKAFAAGAVAIPFALLAEALFYCAGAYLFLFSAEARVCGGAMPPFHAFAHTADFLILVAFAASEEVVKYISAKRFVLTGKDFDEPVDAMIYLITVALGFAAFENFFFLLSAFGNPLFEGIVVTILRFLGATLLHAVSSGVVGYAVALSFYRDGERAYHLTFGLFAATVIHVLFNIFITNANGESGFGQALGMLVLTSLFLIFAFDRVKKIKKAARFQQVALGQNKALLQ